MPDSVDSNIFLYNALEDVAKSKRARELLHDGVTISVRVMNEVASVLRRKARFDWNDVVKFLDFIEARAIVRPLTPAIHREGVRLARRYNFAVYDAMIVAAALDAGSETLWSEDMAHGMVVDGRLTILDPFAPAARGREDAR